MNIPQIEPYASVIIRLFQGVLSVEDRSDWNLLLDYRTPISEYFARIGLQLHVSEKDGYAFVKQSREDAEGNPINLPRLTRSLRLTKFQTLLCVLLRERLDEFDYALDEQSERLIIHYDDLYEMIRPFFSAKTDERSQERRFQRDIKRLTDYGFIKQLSAKSSEFIVQRILKSKINSDQLAEIKRRLAEYGDAEYQSN